MLFSIHLTLISIGVLFLIAQNFVWNANLLFIGIIICIGAMFSIFIDPTLFLPL